MHVSTGVYFVHECRFVSHDNCDPKPPPPHPIIMFITWM